DAVVGTTADGGSCTSWGAHDMVELERRGIPTVLFTAQTFVHDANRSAASFGLAGLPLAVVSLPFTNQKPGDIHRMAELAFDQVQAGLTRAVEPPKAVE